MSSSSVVLIEDSLADATLLQAAVQQSAISMPMHHIEDGQSALDYLRNESNPLPDMVLLDLNMPGKSGHDVLEEIRADSRLRRLPVVVLTSSEDERDIGRCYDQHANAYVVKPMGLSGFRKVADSLNRFWFDVATLPRSPRD